MGRVGSCQICYFGISKKQTKLLALKLLFVTITPQDTYGGMQSEPASTSRRVPTITTQFIDDETDVRRLLYDAYTRAVVSPYIWEYFAEFGPGSRVDKSEV